MADYYDYVLGLVPVSMVSVTVLLAAVGVQFALAVPFGAGAAGLVVAHALFVNGPTAPTAPVDAPARSASTSTPASAAAGTMGAGAD